jgi:subtilase family serine protease
MRLWKVLLPLLASAVCLAQQPDRIAGPIDSSRSIAVAKSLHPLAQPQYDLGAVDLSLKLSYMTLLMAPSPSQQTALDQLLAQQQDRRSSNYHKWLTPQQFANRFGLGHDDLNRVTAWLQSEGFQILSTGGGRNSVIFSGTAGEVQRAFGTEIHHYRVNDEEHIANSSPIMIPIALNGIVSSVMGLHDFRPQPANRGRHFRALRNPRPEYYDGSFVFPNFLAPGDIATIYDLNPLYTASIDGTGQKLAIAGQTDIFLADINDFRSGFGLTPIPTGAGGCTTNGSGIIILPCDTANFQYVLVGSDPGTVSANDIGEADLDVEWSGAVARNAQIIFVNAPATNNGVFDAITSAINPPAGPPLAPVVSASYGEGCEAQATLDLETVFQQGNAEGVTIMNSSGDTGAAACDYNPPNSTAPFSAAVGGLSVNYPASSPEVTAVGGTEISVANDSYPSPSSYWSTTIGANGGTAVTYIPELTWNDDEQFGGFCAANGSNPQFKSLCDPSPGVPVTDGQTFQEDYWISSGGGGASNCWTEGATGICEAGFPQPAWQQGLSVASAPASVRYVPDVSLLASPNFPGYIFCTPQEPNVNNTSTCVSGISIAVNTYESLVGGTSASSPIFAGIVTLLNQYLGSTTGLGNINPSLYTVAASPAAGAFHQVTSGDNNAYCQAGTPAGEPADVICPTAGVFGFSASSADATTGYNLVTGLGSVDANKLAIALKPDFQLTTTPLTPASIPAGQSAGSVLTIAPIAGSVGMVVNFSPSSCTGLPTGATCSFNPTSVTFDGVDDKMTTLTISTLPNMATSSATTVTVIPTNSPSTPVTVSLTVTTTLEKFTLATSAATFPVTVGASVSVPITVTGTNGFIVGTGSSATTVLPLTYSCSGVPALGAAEISCQLPNNGQPTNATGVTISLVTTAPTTKLLRPLSRGSRIFYALLLPGLFGIVFAAGSRSRGLRLLSLMVVLGFSTLWLGACGGGNGGTTGLQNPGTPVGTYAVTINATTGGADPVTSVLGPITINVTAQ